MAVMAADSLFPFSFGLTQNTHITFKSLVNPILKHHSSSDKSKQITNILWCMMILIQFVEGQNNDRYCATLTSQNDFNSAVSACVTVLQLHERMLEQG